ncbi:hypothetical protein [Amycolatopsis sp. lyj-23]|uniref:hypothetical protein n=1 Tax=Amycolatopsis sp. lyj-23 TaxID=2789283 RepID=UPI00397810AF
MNSGNTEPGVQFLLSLIDPGDAAAVRERLGIGVPVPVDDEQAGWRLDRLGAPRAVLLWMLERDDPDTNRVVFHRDRVDDALKRDILRGLPFGSAAGPLPVRVNCGLQWCSHREPHIPASGRGLIGGLREARTMGAARVAARAVSRPDWAAVAEADRAEPLPGFARWALGERIDCPPELRAQFGSHPKFVNRLRNAGIVEPRDYVERGRPPRDVLAVLHFGTQLFPHRVGEAAAVLAPSVRSELGTNLDAWAVLARLLRTFAGTVPELVATCGAIARGE